MRLWCALCVCLGLVWGLLCAPVVAQEVAQEVGDSLCTAQQRQALREQREALEGASDREAAQEWRRSRALRQRVGGGLGHYQRLRRAYLRRGVCDPGRLIRQELELILVGEAWVRVHRSLAPVVREAAALYREHGWRGPRSLGGFHARMIRGPFGEGEVLSHHAFGLALDIDARRNPFLTLEELALLEEISQREVLRGLETPVEQRWRSLDEAVRGFRGNFAAWSQRSAQEMFALRRAAHKKEAGAQEALEALERKRRLALRGAHLRALRRPDGFNLPLELVLALERGGLVWSTDFQHGADLMHFEARPAWAMAPREDRP